MDHAPRVTSHVFCIDASYLGAGKEKQGTYQCSIRPVTIWENPKTVLGKFQGYVHDHPNFHSFYQDAAMGWPDVHTRVAPRVSGFSVGDILATSYFAHAARTTTQTRVGVVTAGGNAQTRTGSWVCAGHGTIGRAPHRGGRKICARTRGTLWRTQTSHSAQSECGKQQPTCAGGSCVPECSGRVSYDIWTATHAGRWFEEDGECIDHVIRGCFNNGTCVAPNTVRDTLALIDGGADGHCAAWLVCVCSGMGG